MSAVAWDQCPENFGNQARELFRETAGSDGIATDALMHYFAIGSAEKADGKLTNSCAARAA
jgi:hypothetical protein